MSTLAGKVKISRRFQRSARIDTDLHDLSALEGFVCPASSAEVLETLGRHVAQTRQGAFTWTGPYGSGKSSLAIALSGLLNGKESCRALAGRIFGKKLSNALLETLPPGAKGWRVLPVLGRRADPARVFGEALEAAGLAPEPPKQWSQEHVLSAIRRTASQTPKSHGGLLIFVDEMGKFLEAAAQDRADIYFFQQLAEQASRSGGRLVVIGILHQAIEQYAHRVSQDMRDEWAKIQGRFVDLPINTAPDEQIDLIARAIVVEGPPKKVSSEALAVAAQLRGGKALSAETVADRLQRCWPLHPVVACLLGPISRRRFGQNQRSVFAFLNSAEPFGFQDFVKHAKARDIYPPVMLWDYLRANLEPAILASPDGHRWALAAEALERCESLGGDTLDLQLLKTIALLDLFKERSGLAPSEELLATCFPGVSKTDRKAGLAKLSRWSLVIFKKFLGAYAVYAGSDFDIDEAVREALAEHDDIDFRALRTLAGLQPILAKRHYHETGTLRWFDVTLAPLTQLAEKAANLAPGSGAIGQFILALPTKGESQELAAEACRNAALHSKSDSVIGLSAQSWPAVALARELIALEAVRSGRPELQGDAVARREVNARFATVQTQVEAELKGAFDSALWHRKGQKDAKPYRHADLNILASELAALRYPKAPVIHNELLNRHKPSNNAVAAQNELLRRMVLNEREERLGIKGFPAEGGLYASLLEATGLHAPGRDGWRFVRPGAHIPDSNRLEPLWTAALKHLQTHAERSVPISEIYKLWAGDLFGIKEGAMPVLITSLLLAERAQIAAYREAVFRPRVDDVDIQYLAKDPATIQLRWMDQGAVSKDLLTRLAGVLTELGQPDIACTPIDVARGLVALYDGLPAWTKRTSRLTGNALRIRDLLKRASDPNKFLFADLPQAVGLEASQPSKKDTPEVVSRIRAGLAELIAAFPDAVSALQDRFFQELDVRVVDRAGIAELRGRAENVRQVGGDFRLEAVIGRLAAFDAADGSFEELASLATGKPPGDWVDFDLDKAAFELADLAQRFLRAETFARVKGRPQKREAMAVVLGTGGAPRAVLEEFAVAAADRDAVNDVIVRVRAALEQADPDRRNIILAALAEVSAQYMSHAQNSPASTKAGKRKVVAG